MTTEADPSEEEVQPREPMVIDEHTIEFLRRMVRNNQRFSLDIPSPREPEDESPEG